MPSRSLPRIARVPTHVPGLDTVLCGGFLRGGIYVVRGAPGSGKTILGNQICFENARRGGSSAYVTLLAESHARMMLHLESVDFFDLELAGDRVRYLSAYGALMKSGLPGVLDFIRAEGYAYAHVADEGIIEASAAKLLRYRKMIGAERVQVWTDVKKKHSAHAITADVSLGQTAETVEFMGADCVIVTGSVTGEAPQVADVKEAKSHCHLPIFLGSGISEANIEQFYNEADGFIIGSAFKVDGLWSNTVDPSRITQFVNKIHR